MMQRLSLLESLMAGGFIFGIAWLILKGVAKDDPKSRARGVPICFWVAIGFATAGYAMQYGAGLGLLVGLMIGHIHGAIACAFVTSTEPELTPSTIEWTTNAEDVPAIDPNPYAPPRRGNS